MRIDLGGGAWAVDAGYVMPGLVSIYIVIGDGGAMIFETGHNASLDVVSRELGELGIAPDKVTDIFITHVHLDHAGGAGLYMRRFPSARLVLHPRGVRHMAGPDVLWRGACAVYGADLARSMYGELVPVPQERMYAPDDGETVVSCGRRVVCMHTPGHCLHHIAFYLEDDRSVFTGDVFGMSHAALVSGTHHGIMPSTSPVQFDPDAMSASIDRIASLAPRRVLLSHFGELREVDEAAADLKRVIALQLDAVCRAHGDLDRTIELISALFDEERTRQGWPFEGEDIRRWTHDLSVMNSKGLVDWYEKRRRA